MRASAQCFARMWWFSLEFFSLLAPSKLGDWYSRGRKQSWTMMQGYNYLKYDLLWFNWKGMIPCILNPTIAETPWGVSSGIEDYGGCKPQVGASYYSRNFLEDHHSKRLGIWNKKPRQKSDSPPPFTISFRTRPGYLTQSMCRQSPKDPGTYFEWFCIRPWFHTTTPYDKVLSKS